MNKQSIIKYCILEKIHDKNILYNYFKMKHDTFFIYVKEWNNSIKPSLKKKIKIRDQFEITFKKVFENTE